MEIITKYNYEEYCIDYIEGTLPPDTRMAFEDFLSQNPEIKAELNAFATVELVPDTEQYSGKETLKKTANNLSLFDELCIDAIEGNANVTQLNHLNKLISNDINMLNSYNAYKKTILVADKQIAFEYKRRLKKQFISPAQKMVLITGALAASILALVLIKQISIQSRNIEPVYNLAQSQVGKNEDKQTRNVSSKLPVPVNTPIQSLASKKQLYIHKSKLAIQNQAIKNDSINDQDSLNKQWQLAVVSYKSMLIPNRTNACIVERTSGYTIETASTYGVFPMFTSLKTYALRLSDKTSGLTKDVFIWNLANEGLTRFNNLAGTNLELYLIRDSVSNETYFKLKSNLLSYY
jgi:hypothetical protein